MQRASAAPQNRDPTCRTRQAPAQQRMSFALRCVRGANAGQFRARPR